MNKKNIEKIMLKFNEITSIEVKVLYMNMGEEHIPTTLEKGKQGVYIFFNENTCFKVGKAGSKSKARWNSHHYNIDNSTPSTLAKSIINHKNETKKYFPVEKHTEIDNLSKDNMKNWIKNNMSRIEFIIPEEKNGFSLNLLEALAQFELKPIFEGKNA